MGRFAASILLLSALSLTGCTASEPTWRSRVAPLIDELGRQNAIKLFPQEYRNLLETFEHGEAVFHVREDDLEADTYYRLAFQKADVLRTELRLTKQRLAEEERKRALETARKTREERFMREASDAELRLLEQQRKIRSGESQGKPPASPSGTVTNEPRQEFPVIHTVRRGETLPQIAGRLEIYNDSSLWPIIYRANRDQISDPKRLWPGQVLVIPRHFSRDDAAGARKYSGRKL